ncbi:hypothetical protein ACET3Z_012841 [Daucus carota]
MHSQMPCYLLLLVFFLSLLPSSLTIVSTRRQEGEALVNWKNSLPPSSFLNYWSVTNLTSLCNWTGIVCNSAGSVSEINLSGKKLSGTLDMFGFTSFPNLKHFTITDNKFSGPIPAGIAYLEELQYLDFSSNNLNGSIPFQVSYLQKLLTLDLTDNHLEAPIWSLFFPMPFLSSMHLARNDLASKFPDFISSCLNLSYLDLSNNFFKGDLVSGSVFKNLHNLESLNIRHNSFEGLFPPTIFNLSKLKVLDLSKNKFSGPIPDKIAMLLKLEDLRLPFNSFNGNIPSSIGRLRNLRHLDLGYNHLNSSIPSELGLLTKLKELYLYSNSLSGSIPPNIGNLKLVEVLLLDFNQLSGPLPNTISNLSNLMVLGINDNKYLSGEIPNDFWKNSVSLATVDFSNNSFHGNILEEFRFHANLDYINLSGNRFTGEIPTTICEAKSLEILDLSHNGLSGTIPHCLGTLAEKLYSVNLGNNQFHGTIPTTFTESCELTFLNMYSNHFEGPLPQALANCKHLKVLDVGHNNISGPFPSWLITLRELEVLVLRSNKFHGIVTGRSISHPFPELRIVDLSDNNFNGSLPIRYLNNIKPSDKVYDYYSLRAQPYYPASISINIKGAEHELSKILYLYTAIDLSCNKFEGEIPRVTGDLRGLVLLNLSHNSLTGPIPSQLGNLIELNSLELSSNKLSGAIPHQLNNLTFLGRFNLSNNNLSGEIPTNGNLNTNFDNSSYLGNSDLCGLPLTKRCTPPISSPPVVDNDQEVGNDDEHDAGNQFDFEVVLMGYGIGLVCGLSTGYIFLTVGKPWWFFKYIVRLQLNLMKRYP